MLIRRADVDDAEAIRAIYNDEVTGGVAVFDIRPRDLDAQRRWIVDRSGAHAVLVAEFDGSVIGFASLSPYRDRPAYNTTVENSVYVHRDHRGGGVGKALLDELLRVAADHGFHTVIARIAGSNAGSVRLHEACGFEHVGIEREVGRKFGRWLDVVEMQHMLGHAPAPPR
ncbi:MAG: N-acetyltransferase family protein [Acidimicrobiales bacterium]